MSSYSFHQRSSCHTLKTKNNERQIKSKYASVMKPSNLILHDVSGFEKHASDTQSTEEANSSAKRDALTNVFSINFYSYLKLTNQITSKSFRQQISWPIAFLDHQKRSQKQRTNLSSPSLQAANMATCDPRAARETDL